MDTGKIVVLSATTAATTGIGAFVAGALVGTGVYILISERNGDFNAETGGA